MSTALAQIGHNQPPGPIGIAHDTMRALADWMAENPIIETGEQASEAKRLLDSAKSCADDVEAERDRLVRPLNQEVEGINAQYKAVHNKDAKRPGTLDRVTNELKVRVSKWLAEEEARREAQAEAKRREVEEAARIAKEAEEREREAIANSNAGELGVDVTAVVLEADAAFKDFKKATREATIAERDATVRISGGWRPSVSLRTKETLILDDPVAAVQAIGRHEKITEAVLSAARDYRKQHGTLPQGVSAKTERTV